MSRRRGPRRPPVIGGGGGSAPAGFTLITGWGETANDGSTVLTSSENDAGTITMVTGTTTTILDGYQEDMPSFDVGLTDLYSDWDDDTDLLELCLEIASMTLGTDKWGLALFVGDNTYANRASMIAKGHMVFPNSITVTNAGEVGATAAGTSASNGTNVNLVTQLYMGIVWEAGGVPRSWAMVKRTSDQAQVSVVGTAGSAMGAAANRRIYVAGYHSAATGAARTLSARVYARRIRRTGPFV